MTREAIEQATIARERKNSRDETEDTTITTH